MEVGTETEKGEVQWERGGEEEKEMVGVGMQVVATCMIPLTPTAKKTWN